ncbi:MAG: AI-2E family transporter, partial [Pontibacterium sp.]
MKQIFSRWVDRYFSDEEALQLFLILAIALGVILTMGQPLTPVFAGIILAFLMQGAVAWLKEHNLPHLGAVIIVFTLFVSLFFALFFVILPLVWRQAANFMNELPSFIGQLQQMALLLPQQYPGIVSEESVREVTNLATKEVSQFGQWVVTFSLNSIGNVLTILVYMVLVPILVFFFLLDG